MSKKLIMGLAPLLAVAAFAVMPAMASAATTAYGVCEVGGVHSAECPEGEKAFKAFEELAPVKILGQKAFGSGNFILATAAGSTLECEGLINSGEVENVAGTGISTERLVFHHCFTAFEGKKCRLNTAGAGAGVIVGVVNDEVITETTVKATVVRGFGLRFSGTPPAGCPAAGTAIGTITGSVSGTQAKGSNVLVFTKAKGIKLGAEETEITGSDEAYTEGGKPVVIGPPAPLFTANPASVKFPTLEAPETKTEVVVLTNISGKEVEAKSYTENESKIFKITDGNKGAKPCLVPRKIPNGGTCEFEVTFEPEAGKKMYGGSYELERVAGPWVTVPFSGSSK